MYVCSSSHMSVVLLFSAYGFDFTYSSADGSLVELKENGSDLPVTWSHRHEYARLVLEFRLHELTAPVRAIRAGLISIIPARFLSLLTWKVRNTYTVAATSDEPLLVTTRAHSSDCLFFSFRNWNSRFVVHLRLISNI